MPMSIKKPLSTTAFYNSRTQAIGRGIFNFSNGGQPQGLLVPAKKSFAGIPKFRYPFSRLNFARAIYHIHIS